MKNDDLEMAREESGPWTKVIMAKSDGACLNSVWVLRVTFTGGDKGFIGINRLHWVGQII